MNKLAIRETFPPGIVGREIVLAQMCHHYRRICRARARVDSNLQKPKSARFLAFEETSFGQRILTPRTPPKHRRCLKYETEIDEQRFKPNVRSQRAESRLRLTPKIYHPAVKSPRNSNQEHEGHPQATQTSQENSLVETDDQKMKDEASQTYHLGLYRPLDVRSVHFIRDIINEALRQRAFTSSSLNRIFREHQFKNVHDLTQELMEKELDELRRQLGMLPRQHNGNMVVSDNEALDALDTLVMDPHIKEQVIQSLRLTRTSESKKPLFLYFDRLVDNEAEEPSLQKTQDMELINEKTNKSHATNGIKEEATDGDSEALEIERAKDDYIEKNDGLDAEIQGDSEESFTQSSLDTEDEEEEQEEGEKLEEDGQESGDDVIEELKSTNNKENSSNYESAEEIDVKEKNEVQESYAKNPDRDESVENLNEIQHEEDNEEQVDEEDESVTEHEEIEEVGSEISSGDEILSDYEDKEYESEMPSDQIANLNAIDTHNETNLNSANDNVSHSMKDSDECSPMLQPLKLESTNSKDKWRSSLEVVQEECDSTIKEISDISSSSPRQSNS